MLQAIESATKVVEDAIAQEPAPGFAVSVMVDGQFVWSTGFGYADLEQDVPMRPTSRTRIGSVSKPMAAAAVMRLWDQGLVDLDAPVQTYVPAFPDKRWTVTTRQLGGHLGGVRHYRGAEMLSSRPYATVDEGLTIFAEDTLMHEPGTQFLYTSYGWNLISAVVEGAAGQPFLVALEEEVLDPIGLKETIADHPDSLVSQRVRFYVRRDLGGFMNAPYVDNSYKWAGGGLLSSTEDVARFAHAHLGDEYLSAEARSILFTSQATTDGEETNYGFGWRTTEVEGREYLLHGGGSVGGSTMLMMQPDTRVVISAHVNLTGYDVGAVTRRLMTLFVNAVAGDAE